MMDENKSMPIWVTLAFSSIRTRKSALILIGACMLFTVYCVPWSQYTRGEPWLSRLFLIDDWSWFAMMVPIVVWYWISLRWMDRNNAWAD